MSRLELSVLRRLAHLVKGQLLATVKTRLSGAEEFGEQPTIVGKVIFELMGAATFGHHFQAEGRPTPVTILAGPSATLSVGNYVGMATGVCVEAWHDVRIGNNVMLAPFVFIIDDDRHSVEPDSVRFHGPTIIGNNVWLGRGVSVLPGVTIGDGSVVGANSVVSRDIPPNSFAAGAPARVLKKLDLPAGWTRYGLPPDIADPAPGTVIRWSR